MEMVPREPISRLPQKGDDSGRGFGKKAAKSGLKIRKISTESLFCCPVIRRCAPRPESLALLEFAAFSPHPTAGGFHSLAQFSTVSAPTRKMALAVSLEIHGQDTRHCQ